MGPVGRNSPTMVYHADTVIRPDVLRFGYGHGPTTMTSKVPLTIQAPGVTGRDPSTFRSCSAPPHRITTIVHCRIESYICVYNYWRDTLRDLDYPSSRCNWTRSRYFPVVFCSSSSCHNCSPLPYRSHTFVYTITGGIRHVTLTIQAPGVTGRDPGTFRSCSAPPHRVTTAVHYRIESYIFVHNYWRDTPCDLDYPSSRCNWTRSRYFPVVFCSSSSCHNCSVTGRDPGTFRSCSAPAHRVTTAVHYRIESYICVHNYWRDTLCDLDYPSSSVTGRDPGDGKRTDTPLGSGQPQVNVRRQGLESVGEAAHHRQTTSLRGEYDSSGNIQGLKEFQFVKTE
ncbi:hypothetical protein J6590_033725 [Homalodisca vitripennis]|nr:hypothetical protein J6590_033725 [Homalodisca vitripennis]